MPSLATSAIMLINCNSYMCSYFSMEGTPCGQRCLLRMFVSMRQAHNQQNRCAPARAATILVRSCAQAT